MASAGAAKRSLALPPSLAAAVQARPNGHPTRRARSPTEASTAPKPKRLRPFPSPTPPITATATATDDHKQPDPTATAPQPAPAPASTARRQLLADLAFVIVLGVDITAGRRDVWRTQVEKRGGRVVATLGRDVTHVVVPTDFDGWAAWRDGVRDRYVRRWKVVRAEWMVQTLTKGVISSYSRFIVDHMAKLQAPVAPPASSGSSNSTASLDDGAFIPSSPPSLASYASDMPPLSPALSQQSTPTPSPVKYQPSPVKQRPPPQPSPSLAEPHLSVPNSDDDDDDALQSHPTMAKPHTEYLIDPTLHPTHSTQPHHTPTPAAAYSVLKPHPYFTHNKAKLACQTQSSSLVNHNANITDVLERLEEMNAAVGDKWRAYSYRKAVGIVKQFPRPIASDSDLAEIGRVRGMGGKMTGKIREIITTGTLTKVGHMEKDERMQVMERFTKIHGVGASTAARWYALGLRTLNDVSASPHVELSAQQRVGLEFYEDKLRRIPRVEVRAVEEYVREEAERLLPGVQVICCGSYRRGKPSSGDVDLLITHDSFGDTRQAWRHREDFMVMLMRRLEANICTPFWWKKKREETVSSAEKEESIEQEVAGETVKGEVKHESKVKAEAVKDEDAAATQALKAEESKQQATQPLPFDEPDNDDDDIAITQSTKATTSSSPSPASSADELPLPPFITGRLQPFERLTMKHAQANFMGFCCLPAGHPQWSGINRRLDIKVYPVSMFPFALLYFTGSDHFNRSMRFYAKRCGWSLSDHGLQPVNRALDRGAGDKVWIGSTVLCRSERDVFDAMGLEFVAPHQRNVYQHFDLTDEEVKRMKAEADADEKREQQGDGQDGDGQVGGSEGRLGGEKDGVHSDSGDSAVSKDGMEPEDLYSRQ